MIMEKLPGINVETWTPRTQLGKLVKEGQITKVEEIFDLGKKILEPEIVDVLLNEIYSETLLIQTTQRVTDNGRKMQFRIVVVVGDKRNHVGVGVAKGLEVRPTIEAAIRNAKKNIISFKTGCGSWECRCSYKHTLPMTVKGKYGGTTVVLKPAPRGVGLACNDNIKKILSIGGLKDVWSQTTGNTDNVYNTVMATIKALEKTEVRKPSPVVEM